MATFDDWLAVSDPSSMATALAEQFRLSQNELRKASEALAPAFAIGFQRAMGDPSAWADLSNAFTALAPQNFSKAGSTGGAGAAGPAFLNAVFGSDALVGAVARQASLFAGIAPDVIQKLMPGLAAMTMDVMVRQTMEAMRRNQPAGLATGDMGAATAEMMRRGANAVEALSRPSDEPAPRRKGAANPILTPNPMAEAFAEALKTGFGWFAPSSSPSQAATPQATPAPEKAQGKPATETFNPMLPFAMMFDAFAKGVSAANDGAEVKSPDAAPQAAPVPPREKPDEGTGPEEGLAFEMMRSGQKFQEDYAREMAALFERYQGELKTG